MAEAWPRSVAEARPVQAAIRERVETSDRLGAVRHLAGFDVHYDAARNLTFGAAVLLDAAGLDLVESALVALPTAFPYVPGYLSFREGPAALAALARLSRRPDLLFVDGHGFSHPRRAGIASHIGVLADLPTIGVAKSRLTGVHDAPGAAPGTWAPVHDRGELVGAVLRTRAGARPVYVSTGHRVSLATALAWVLRTGAGYRLPEPARLADRLSRAHG